MNCVIIGLLLVETLSQTVLLSSSPSTAIIISPSGYTLVPETYHNTNNPNYLGNGAQWIWLNGSSSWPLGFSASFQSTFYVDCPQISATLRITADDEFKAILNGNTVGTGTSWQKVYIFDVKLECGWNELKVEVKNNYANTPAALIFTIVQDQTKCFECHRNPSAFYNRKTCSCQCSTKCDCLNKLHIWHDYPICGCKCKKDAYESCRPLTHFWDQVSCSCQCKPRWCPLGFFQSPNTCQCFCVQNKDCLSGYVWNKYTCSCEEKNTVQTNIAQEAEATP